MKAITIHQPWASLIACGAKKFETRSWHTNYKGQIAIHAGKKPYKSINHNPAFEKAAIESLLLADSSSWKPIIGDIVKVLEAEYLFSTLPYGAIIATAELVECWHCACACVCEDNQCGMILVKSDINNPNINFYNGDISEQELLFGDFSTGRYAWQLENVKMLDKPIPCKGQQGLWNFKEDLA